MTTVELLPPIPEDVHPCHPPYVLEPETVQFLWVDGALHQCTQCGQHWQGVGRYWFKVTRRDAERAIKRRARGRG